MKINVEVDISADEMRRFLGLPEVAPIQAMLMDRVKAQVESGLDGTLVPNLVRSMVSGGIQSMEAYQQLFSDLLGAARAKRGGAGSDEPA